MTDVRIAHRSAVVDLDGTPARVRRGRTLAEGSHPIVVDHPELWRPLVVDYDEYTPPAEPEPVEDARPANSAARSTWDAYAATLGLDSDGYSTKTDLIEACDAEADG